MFDPLPSPAGPRCRDSTLAASTTPVLLLSPPGDGNEERSTDGTGDRLPTDDRSRTVAGREVETWR